MNSTTALRVAALVGFLGVALGAFGAHALSKVLDEHKMAEVWRTAVFYHLIHAVMLLLLAQRERWNPGPWFCFLLGIVLFSGSLYLLAGTTIRWFGYITPVGGVSFLAGWIWLGVSKF